MKPEIAARALWKLALGQRVSEKTAANLRARGLAVEHMRPVGVARRWVSATGVSREGMRWLNAYDEAPFGIELPGSKREPTQKTIDRHRRLGIVR